MKREEFFEALSDIDEEMVASARQSGEKISAAAANQNEEASVPIIVTPKKSRMKPICVTAACIVLAAAVTVTAVSISRRPNSVITPGSKDKTYSTRMEVFGKNHFGYPEWSYTYTGDYSNLEIKYRCDEFPDTVGEPQYKSYDELAADSSLIVMGTFTDDPCQVTAEHDAPDFLEVTVSSSFNKYVSFNILSVEKVLKSDGQVYDGDEIAIIQPLVCADGGMYSFSQLTPMKRGDSWVYFLNQYGKEYPEKIYGSGAYYAVNDYEGRYPVPGNENESFKYRENDHGVVAPASFNKAIYAELGGRISEAGECRRQAVEIESGKVTDIAGELGISENYPVGIGVKLEMGEYPGEVFYLQDGALYVPSKPEMNVDKIVIGGGGGVFLNLSSTYLCDLNGDGKREICTEISFGSGIVNNIIWVWDIANAETYVLNDGALHNYYLREKDGELMYRCCEWKNMDMTGESGDFSEDILTLDIMKGFYSSGTTMEHEQTENVKKIMDLAEYPSSADLPIVFDIEEFPDVMFERKTGMDLGDSVYAETEGDSRLLFSGRQITAIYLSDLNGDGKPEICANIDNIYDNSRLISVYDYANSQEYILGGQVKNSTEKAEFEYVISVMDDTLYCQRNPLIEGCSLKEPLTLDLMTKVVRD